MHFFSAGEWTRVDQFYTVNTGLPQSYSSVEGTFPQPFHRYLYFGRLDSQISNSQSWFARVAREDSDRPAAGAAARRRRRPASIRKRRAAASSSATPGSAERAS